MDDLIGFCTFGSDARVPGGDYCAPALDIGLGIRPDHTGLGNGSRYVAAVADFAAAAFQTEQMRVTISESNKTSAAGVGDAGFERTERFNTPKDFAGTGGGAFVVFVRSTEP